MYLLDATVSLKTCCQLEQHEMLCILTQVDRRQYMGSMLDFCLKLTMNVCLMVYNVSTHILPKNNVFTSNHKYTMRYKHLQQIR